MKTDLNPVGLAECHPLLVGYRIAVMIHPIDADYQRAIDLDDEREYRRYRPAKNSNFTSKVQSFDGSLHQFAELYAPEWGNE